MQQHRSPKMETGGKVVLQFSRPARLRGAGAVACGPRQDSDVNLLNLGLGRSIYSKEQMEDFAQFQDSQNTRKAYLAEAAELAYLGRNWREIKLSMWWDTG
jgi:hypothetical protein